MTPIRSSPSRWLWGLLAAVVAGLIWWHATILLPFVVSIILAYVLRPAVQALEKRRCPRALAAMACLFGAAFLLLVDDLARTLAATEIPIGILTAFVGAPFFIYLMHQKGGGV